MRYETRNHAFTPPATWVIDVPWLCLEEHGAAPTTHAWALIDVTQVRLEFSPTRAEPNRHRCRLTFRNGATRDFFNRTYSGFMDFRDRSVPYVEFVRALHAALAAAHSSPSACRFVAGVTRGTYVLNLAIIAFVLAGLVALACLLYTIGLTWFVVLKVLLVLVYLPTLFEWARRNRPRGYSPAEIPAEVLPAA